MKEKVAMDEHNTFIWHDLILIKCHETFKTSSVYRVNLIMYNNGQKNARLIDDIPESFGLGIKLRK